MWQPINGEKMSYFLVFRNPSITFPLVGNNDGKSLIVPIRECQPYVQGIVSDYWQIDGFVYTLSDPLGGDQCDEIIQNANDDFHYKSTDYSDTYFFRIISLLISKHSDIIFWYGDNLLKEPFYIPYALFPHAVMEYINGSNSDYNSSILITGSSVCPNDCP